jgi:hypothetical protein
MHTDPCGKEKAVANEWSSRVTMAIQRERRSGWYIGDCKRWKCYNSKRLGSMRGSGEAVEGEFGVAARERILRCPWRQEYKENVPLAVRLEGC